jgi:hypothetical protein
MRVVVAKRFSGSFASIFAHAGPARRQRLRDLRHLLGEDVEHAVAGERRRARHHLVRDAAELVDVGAPIDAIAARLLRRHVARIAERHAEARRRGLCVTFDELREPEVEQLDEVRLAAADREVDVARPQIAMHVADRVRFHQRLADLDQDVGGLLDRQRLLARERGVERLAFEQLHREIQPAVGRAPEVVDLDDVLVVDLGDRRRLAPKPLDREVVARQLVVQHFDRDLAAQRHVLGAVNGAGSTLPDQLLDLKAFAEQLADQRIERDGGFAQLRTTAVRTEQRVLRIRVLATGAGDRSHVMSGHKSPDGRRFRA